MNNEQNGHALDWGSQIEKDTDYIILPEGDYDFTVTDLERKRYEPKPGSKLSACPQAVITLTINSEQGEVKIKHNLFLHTMFEGRISQFFIGIGQKKKGHPLVMNWNKVVGSTGQVHLVVDHFKNNNGETITNNKVDKFLVPQEPQVAQSPFPQQQNAPQTKFNPGSF